MKILWMIHMYAVYVDNPEDFCICFTEILPGLDTELMREC